MLYFFYGADDYRLKEKVNSVIAQYQAKHKSGLNFSRFNMEREGAFEKLKDFLGAYSMFAEKKLAIAENILETSDLSDDFFKKQAADKEIFLFLCQELSLNEDKKKGGKYVFRNKDASGAFEKLKKIAQAAEEFDLLGGAKLENWIKKKVVENGGQIAAEAVKKLVVFVGPDLWRLANEVDKLLSFKAGGLIIARDIDLQVGAQIESDIFKTVDALATRQKNTVYKLLHEHLAQGASEIYLLSMLVYQFRNLLLVKDQLERGSQFNVLAAKLKMHPFVLRKSFEQSKNFSLKALKNIYSRLAEIDIHIKTGQVQPRIALDLLVQEIAG